MVFDMKKLFATAALAAALSAGTASLAHAEVFMLTLSDPTAGLAAGPFGEVDVTGEGGTALNFVVSLYGTNDFHWTNDSNHHALAFSLVGDPSLTISGLAAPFSANGVEAAGANSATPFGQFDYVINFPKATGRHAPPMPLIQTFSFTATGASNLFLKSTAGGYGDVFFATDIRDGAGATGNVGALRTPVTIGNNVPGVPEPATWTMLIMGFGAMGSVLRRSRRQLARATA
jgi:hypothetical protein